MERKDIKLQLQHIFYNKVFKVLNKFDKGRRFISTLFDFYEYYDTFKHSHNENGFEVLDILKYKLQNIQDSILLHSTREDKNKILTKINEIICLISSIENKDYGGEDWEKDMKKDVTVVFRKTKNIMFDLWI